MLEDTDKIKWKGKNYKILDTTYKFRFTCDKCGRCCSDIDIILNPYDVIRIIKKLRITAREFITKYCHLIKGNQSKLPIILLVTNPKCGFNQNGLCQIYEDRPQVCRSYPIGRVTSPEGKERYILVKNCSKVHFRLQRVQTINKWLENEGVSEYYEVTKGWTDFILKIVKNEYPKENSQFFNLFVEVCYNVDSEAYRKLFDKLGVQLSDDPKEIFRIVIKTANIILLNYKDLTEKLKKD